MFRPTSISTNLSCRSHSKSSLVHILMIIPLACFLFPVIAYAGTAGSSMHDGISLQRISAPSGGYGYRLQYYVAAPIDVFWRFKTDFGSDILLTNEELIEHRLVESFDGGVITENRYASAPGLRFLWQTNVISGKFKLEFRLLNNEDCRHDFHISVFYDRWSKCF